MELEKQSIVKEVEKQGDSLIALGDQIHEWKEVSYEEHRSSQQIQAYLREHGFQVEPGVGGLPTAFRAVYEQGKGGPSIGLLCEYDALAELGHGCAHHLQAPAILGAACAVKNCLKEAPYRLVVYGTPGEETTGGKITMVKNGCFQDIDVALMVHGGDHTQVDVKSMALVTAHVTFHGIAAHAAIAPDKGRSALDAMILMFNGIEFLREHIREDSRIHYTVDEVPGHQNSVPSLAKASMDIRSYNSLYLDGLVDRVKDIAKGAALMTGTTFEISLDDPFESKVPALYLNQLVMDNAKQVKAPAMAPAREKTGSTDFGNVTFRVPGTCLRLAFVDPGTPSHTEAWVEQGMSQRAHQAILLGAKIIGMTVYDLVAHPENLQKVQEEFRNNRETMALA